MTEYQQGDATVDTLAHWKRLPAQQLRDLGLQDGDGCVTIPYLDENGELVYRRMRFWLGKKNHTYSPKGCRHVPYGLWRLPAPKFRKVVFVVEGESDCWTLWHWGFDALGIPNATSTGCLTVECLEAWDCVCIVQEPDEAGRAFREGVIRRLKALGHSRMVTCLQMDERYKDPSEIHKAKGPGFVKLWKAMAGKAEMIDLFPEVVPPPTVPATPKAEALWDAPIPLGQLPPVPEFPLALFPEPFRVFVEEAAFATNSPCGYAGPFALTLAAAAVGNSRQFWLKPDWPEKAILWTAVVAPPGSGKSPALLCVGRSTDELQGQRHHAYLALKKAYKPEGGQSDEPPPTLEHVKVSNLTLEMLLETLAQCPRGVVRVEDEISAVTAMADKYSKGQGGGDKQYLCTIWNGSSVQYMRVKQKGEPLLIRQPFLCMTGGIPPDCLASLRGEREVWDGWFDRFLWTYEDPRPVGPETWRSVNLESHENWAKLLGQLRNLEMQTGTDGVLSPQRLYPSSDARTSWEFFAQALANRLNAEDFPPHMRGPWLKLKSYCLRFALLFQMLRFVNGDTVEEDIDSESMNRAHELVNYFGAHAQRVYCSIDADPLQEQSRKLLASIKGRGEGVVSRRDLYLAVKNHTSWRKPEDLDAPLAYLVSFGHLRPVEMDANPRGGRPRGPCWYVCPL